MISKLFLNYIWNTVITTIVIEKGGKWLTNQGSWTTEAQLKKMLNLIDWLNAELYLLPPTGSFFYTQSPVCVLVGSVCYLFRNDNYTFNQTTSVIVWNFIISYDLLEEGSFFYLGTLCHIIFCLPMQTL